MILLHVDSGVFNYTDAILTKYVLQYIPVLFNFNVWAKTAPKIMGQSNILEFNQHENILQLYLVNILY